MNSKRLERLHPQSKKEDQRKEFEIDRDRLIYSFAFRRLAQVTQVASVNEGNIFHNRLTHSLKVAQVGRRVAEYLNQITDTALINQCGGLNPDVVETACLAHDLGHPPFGHIAEKELDKVAIEAGLLDGFEGNAQTFRILTRLEPYKPHYPGLNLTRATLNATLKYPWFREKKNLQSKKSKKFSVYELDQETFNFVRPDENERKSERLTLEASVMEFADDITYSVHDLEDFYLAGLIPINILVEKREAWENFVHKWLNSNSLNKNDIIKNKVQQPKEQKRLRRFLSTYIPPKYAPKTIEEITYIRANSSLLIQRYIQSASITQNYGKYGYLERKLDEEIEIELLQRLVWKYVITNPYLATQHHGQQRIIRELFYIYKGAIEENQIKLIPPRFLQDGSINSLIGTDNTSQQKIRLAVDIVASLRESEAILLYRRLTGIEQNSIMDYIHNY